jgi:MFS family permease
MKPSMSTDNSDPAGKLSMQDYYLVEGLNAIAFTLFTCCAVFWTKHRFGFSDADNLLLNSVGGFTYIFGALYGGKFAIHFGYERVLAFCLLGLALIMLVGWLPTWHYIPFLLFFLYTLAIGPSWPVLEALILHARARMTMPDRLGLYNVTWAFGDAVGFFASGFLFAWKPDSILWVAGLLHTLGLAWMRRPIPASAAEGTAAMEIPHRGDTISRPLKRRFMLTGWLGNGISFGILYSFLALTPQMAERLNLSPSYAIWLACTLFFARGLAFFILWKWESWHYRWSWIQAALWIAPISLAVAFFAEQRWMVFGALTVMGFAMGLSYSSSIYYSLDYGENKGEHGGLHESILGIGGFIAPLAGALACHFLNGTVGAQWTIVALALVANVVGLAWIAQSRGPDEATSPASS